MKSPQRLFTWFTVIVAIALLALMYLWSSSHKIIGAGNEVKAQAQATRSGPVPPPLTHHMLSPGNITGIKSYHQVTASVGAKGADTKVPETSITKLERSNEMKAENRSEPPPPPLTHHMLGPGNEQYATYINNLQMCLDATNLTDYFHREKFLSTAVANVKYYVDILHEYIPHQFNATLPNHCWRDNAELVIGSSNFSGHIGQTQYKISRSGIDSNRYTQLAVMRDLNYTEEYFVPLSCIPEVFIAGFPKCGTGNMYTMVTSHPAISRSIQKEPSWWDKSEHFTHNTMKNALYMADYLVNFRPLVEKLSVTESRNPVYGVDGSTTTIYRFPKFRNKWIIDVCLLPSVLPVVLPKVKFIVMLRNPVTYLYSHFWYSCSSIYRKSLPSKVASNGPDVFHDRVLEKIASFHYCIARFPLAKCAQITESPVKYNAKMPKCGDIFISIAIYYVHIQKWLSVVPRKRWLFVTTEELSANKSQTLNRVWDFLNIPPMKEEAQERKGSQIYVEYHNKKSLFMRNDTREILKDFFRPYNQMLADLLGDRKFLWEDS